jgi:hypothetical protein
MVQPTPPIILVKFRPNCQATVPRSTILLKENVRSIEGGPSTGLWMTEANPGNLNYYLSNSLGRKRVQTLHSKEWHTTHSSWGYHVCTCEP